MSTTQPVECHKMAELSQSTYLRFSLIFNLLVAVAALPVLIWATKKWWSMKYTKVFHVNFKIIVQLHLFGFMLHCVGRIILHSIDLINYTSSSDPCEMVPNIYRCLVLRLMYNAGLWITNSTAVSLIFERWLATRRSVTYERDSVLFGLLAAVMQLFVTSIPLVLLYWNVTLTGPPMYYCVAAQATLPGAPQLSAALCICFQVTARVSFHFLFRHNQVRVAEAYSDGEQRFGSLQHLRRARLTTSTLSNRFQLEQNMSSIACLKTFANMSSLYVCLQNVSFIVLMHFASSLPAYQYFATTELNGSYPTYSIITVIVMSRTIKSVRKQAESRLKDHLATPNQIYIDNFKKQIA